MIHYFWRGDLLKIGYARVSTPDQKLDLQLDALHAEGCERIFTDISSGSKSERPGLKDAFSHLRSGDVLVVWKLDRFGRSLKDLIDRVDSLRKEGVSFRSLQESLDTSTPAGQMIFHVIGALAQFERDLIRERTRAGLDSARSRGKKGGRKFKLSSSQIEQLVRLYESRSIPVAEIAGTFHITRESVYRYLALWKKRQKNGGK